MDADEEDLYDALMLIAENDSKAYSERKRDPRRAATGAVMRAWKDWKEEVDRNREEDFKSVKDKLVKDLQAQWRKEGRE
jgi:hypothetical protein